MSNPFEVVAEMTATVYEGGAVVLSSSEFSVGDLVYVMPYENPNRNLPERVSGVVEQVLPNGEYIVRFDDPYADLVSPYDRVVLDEYEIHAGGMCESCYKLHSTTTRVHTGWECIIIGGASRMVYTDLCASCNEDEQEGQYAEVSGAGEPTQSGIGYNY